MSGQIGRPATLREMWGAIRGAVAEHMPTADLWTSVRNAAESAGYSGITGSVAEMNALRGAANSIRRAAAAFATAGPSEPTSAAWIAADVDAKPLDARSITPVYRVSFVQTTQDITGVLRTQYRTISYPLRLPPTKAALLADLEADAAVLASTYGEQHLAMANIQITVV